MGRTRVAVPVPVPADMPGTKVDMVKAALGALGSDAKPEAIRVHILDHFSQDLPKSIISNYKSTIKKKGAKTGAAAAARRPRAGSGGNLRLEDLEAVRGLVGRLGADHVRRLVNLLD